MQEKSLHLHCNSKAAAAGSGKLFGEIRTAQERVLTTFTSNRIIYRGTKQELNKKKNKLSISVHNNRNKV